MRATIYQSGLCTTTVKYRPRPSLFFFPGLTQTHPFPNASSFAWCKEITPAVVRGIRDEYVALRDSHVKSDYTLTDHEQTLHKGKWEWHSYLSKGRRQSQFAVACPFTTSFLESVPGLLRDVPFGYAFFSVLAPGSTIAAHHGPCNLRVRCHLPLIVPREPDHKAQQHQATHTTSPKERELKHGLMCGIRVGAEVRPWVEGSPLLLDDTFEHEVWHNGTASDGERVVLLFDFWHPELHQDEQYALQEMFANASASSSA